MTDAVGKVYDRLKKMEGDLAELGETNAFAKIACIVEAVSDSEGILQDNASSVIRFVRNPTIKFHVPEEQPVELTFYVVSNVIETLLEDVIDNGDGLSRCINLQSMFVKSWLETDPRSSRDVLKLILDVCCDSTVKAQAVYSDLRSAYVNALAAIKASFEANVGSQGVLDAVLQKVAELHNVAQTMRTLHEPEQEITRVESDSIAAIVSKFQSMPENILAINVFSLIRCAMPPDAMTALRFVEQIHRPLEPTFKGLMSPPAFVPSPAPSVDYSAQNSPGAVASAGVDAAGAAAAATAAGSNEERASSEDEETESSEEEYEQESLPGSDEEWEETDSVGSKRSRRSFDETERAGAGAGATRGRKPKPRITYTPADLGHPFIDYYSPIRTSRPNSATPYKGVDNANYSKEPSGKGYRVRTPKDKKTVGLFENLETAGIVASYSRAHPCYTPAQIMGRIEELASRPRAVRSGPAPTSAAGSWHRSD